MKKAIQFDDTQARAFRKKVEVMAFQSQDAITFHKTWGEQEVRAGSWIIVSLTKEGNPTGDVYGCDAEVFADTYEPSDSSKPHIYRKKQIINAYQPGHAFCLDTVLSDGHVEVKGSSTDSEDAWVVKAPGGEAYIIENKEFRRTYVEVD